MDNTKRHRRFVAGDCENRIQKENELCDKGKGSLREGESAYWIAVYMGWMGMNYTRRTSLV